MSGERKAILEAAASEFAEVGLKDSSMDSIAVRAGMEAGAVRALFVDKATLLRELLKEATDPLVSGIALAVEEIDDSREVVRKSLQLYDMWLVDNQEIVQIMVRCSLEGPESLQKLYESSLLPSEFYEQLQKIINKGELRCKDLFILSLMFDSLILLPHMLRAAVELMNPGQTAQQTLEMRFDAMIDLFENGLYAR